MIHEIQWFILRFLSDEKPSLQTLDFTFYIGRQYTDFLYFDLYFNTAYAVTCLTIFQFRIASKEISTCSGRIHFSTKRLFHLRCLASQVKHLHMNRNSLNIGVKLSYLKHLNHTTMYKTTQTYTSPYHTTCTHHTTPHHTTPDTTLYITHVTSFSGSPKTDW